MAALQPGSRPHVLVWLKSWRFGFIVCRQFSTLAVPKVARAFASVVDGGSLCRSEYPTSRVNASRMKRSSADSV
jgi:hypothetical protein